MTPPSRMLLDLSEWEEIWAQVGSAIFQVHNPCGPELLATGFKPEPFREMLASFDFGRGRSPAELVDFIVGGLRTGVVPATNPRYYGLYNPGTGSMGAIGDALAAGFNPQLAAWTHAPFPNEIERHLVRAFGDKFGISEADGVFTTAGAEANHTAVVCALTTKFPSFAEEGIQALCGQPILYVSEQAHHSFIKAARFCGLGSNSVRQVPVDDGFALDPAALSLMIEEDRGAGRLPFMVTATAGTTSGGIVDPLPAIGRIAREEGLWFHTDAAWGGAAALSPSLRGSLQGIEVSDSITFDPHKWLSIPMGAGMIIVRDPNVLGQACRITTDYMPRDGRGLDVVDQYTHSLQWSRRFIGLKLFMTIAHLGWEGYAAVIDRQAEVGRYLKDQLTRNSWRVVNDTPFPIACFTRDGWSEAELLASVNRVVAAGEAWISFTRLRSDTPVIRACITHFATSEADIDALIESLSQ